MIEGMNRWSTGIFQKSETILRLSLWMTFIIHLSKPTGHTTERVDPDTHYGLLLISMYEYWHIGCKKCTTPIQTVNNRKKCGGRRVGNCGGYWNSVLSIPVLSLFTFSCF